MINVIKAVFMVLVIVALVLLCVRVVPTMYAKVAPMCAQAAEPISGWLRSFPGFNFN